MYAYTYTLIYMYTTSQQPTRCIHQASDGQEATTCKKATSARAKPSLRRPGRGWRPGQTGQATQADNLFLCFFLFLMFILLVSECFVHTVVATLLRVLAPRATHSLGCRALHDFIACLLCALLALRYLPPQHGVRLFKRIFWSGYFQEIRAYL